MYGFYFPVLTCRGYYRAEKDQKLLFAVPERDICCRRSRKTEKKWRGDMRSFWVHPLQNWCQVVRIFRNIGIPENSPRCGQRKKGREAQGDRNAAEEEGEEYGNAGREVEGKANHGRGSWSISLSSENPKKKNLGRGEEGPPRTSGAGGSNTNKTGSFFCSSPSRGGLGWSHEEVKGVGGRSSGISFDGWTGSTSRVTAGVPFQDEDPAVFLY